MALDARRMRGVLGVLLLVVAHASTARAAGRCQDCVSAGAAAVDLKIPPGTPLAGYGSLARRLFVPDLFGRSPHAFWFKPHDGQMDPLRARAVVLEGSGRRLVWIAADLVAVDRALTAAVTARIGAGGLSGADVLISASHTHSGPGAFLHARLLGVVSVDQEDPEVRESVVAAMADAALEAYRARQPARIGAASRIGPDVTVGRIGLPVDRDLLVLRIESERGRPIAVLWNYAIHGTMLGPKNLKFSGDVVGLASGLVERAMGVPALFVNGTVADVSPRRHGLEPMRAVAQDLGRAVQALWREAQPGVHVPLRVRRMRVAMPPPVLSLRNCVGGWVPGGLTLPLGWTLPSDAELVAGMLGDTAWVAVPGELQSALGRGVKDLAGAPWRRAFVAGLSNDYLGYFVTPADYERRVYISCVSLYGPTGGERLAGAAAELLRHLGEGAP